MPCVRHFLLFCVPLMTLFTNVLAQQCQTMLQFDQASYSVNEEGGSLTINVVRTGNNGDDIDIVSINAFIVTSSAYVGLDYDIPFYTSEVPLIWESGDMEPQSFTIMILDDTIAEGNESLTLTLRKPLDEKVCRGKQAIAKVTIIDNEAENCQSNKTFAWHPTTGAERYFANTCDIPPGWQLGEIPDSDGDGWSDAIERRYGSNPHYIESIPLKIKVPARLAIYYAWPSAVYFVYGGVERGMGIFYVFDMVVFCDGVEHP